ncbi:MAG: glutathione ABC transporter substrate-binding protein [Fusobacteriaceae bacterium]
MKKFLKNLFCITLMSALVVACGEKKDASDSKADSKDAKATSTKEALVIAQGADAKSLDPDATNDQPSSRVSAQIYSRLVDQDEKMMPQPALAESWENPDPKTTIFHLRKGVKFHNGEELKASDVKFSLDRMKDSAQVSHIIEAVDKVEVIDDYTVKVTTKEAFGPLLNHLAHTAASILNEKAVKESGASYGQHPVGTGPYAFEKWMSGDAITLKAFPDYYLGKPTLNKIIFRNVPDGTNRAIGLETKEIDLSYEIDPMDKKLIQDSKTMSLIEEPSLSMSYLGFNMKKPIFQDKRVRQAIAYALDREPIIETVYKGAATIANSPIGPLVFGSSDHTKPVYNQNIEKAKALLKEAGYENGLSFKIWVNDNPQRRDIATIMQDQLNQVGIKVTIETIEWGAFLDGTAKGEHDAFIMGWVTVTGDADYGLNALFNSATQGGAGNRSFYSNPKVDELLEKGKVSMNSEERKAIYAEIQDIIQEDLPVFTLAYLKQNAGFQNYVKNFKLNPAGHHKLNGVTIEQ